MNQDEADQKVEALITGRKIFEMLREKGRTCGYCSTVAKGIHDAVNDERERINNIKGAGER